MAAAEILKERGAYKIYVMATHGILSAEAPRLIEESSIDEVRPPTAPLGDREGLVSCAAPLQSAHVAGMRGGACVGERVSLSVGSPRAPQCNVSLGASRCCGSAALGTGLLPRRHGLLRRGPPTPRGMRTRACGGRKPSPHVKSAKFSW